MLGAAAALLSIATFATPASAQRYDRGYHSGHNYRDYGRNFRTTIRCSGDRCATWRCDGNGWHCRQISGWYPRSGAYQRSRYYHRHRYTDRDRYDGDRDRDWRRH